MDDHPKRLVALCVTVADGKYTVKQDASGRLTALRYGEPWRDCVGDGLICALAYEVDSLRERLQCTTQAHLCSQGIPEEVAKREAARVTHNKDPQPGRRMERYFVRVWISPEFTVQAADLPGCLSQGDGSVQSCLEQIEEAFRLLVDSYHSYGESIPWHPGGMCPLFHVERFITVDIDHE